MDPNINFADSTGATRVVDPVLTEVARGYRNAEHAFSHLFPVVYVGQRGGRVIEFNAEHMQRADLFRAPGGRRARLDVGYGSQKYAVSQRAADGVVPIERIQEAAEVPGIALGRVAASRSMKFASFQVELEAGALATDAGSYPAANVVALAGDDQWSHANSTPAAKVKGLKETIRTGVGMEPNVLLINAETLDSLQENPDVVDRVKHTRGPSDDPITAELLAGYFGVAKVVVARTRVGEPGNFQSVWGKNAILAYVGVSTLDSAEADMAEPSFGYTYRLEGYPMIGEPWWDPSCDSWIYPATCEDAPVIAGPSAGVLLQNVIG